MRLCCVCPVPSVQPNKLSLDTGTQDGMFHCISTCSDWICEASPRPHPSSDVIIRNSETPPEEGCDDVKIGDMCDETV